jgi:hypothetical protein
VIAVTPQPTAEEAAAILAAVQAVLDGERARAGGDPRPAAYRSAWRGAALAGGTDDGMTDRWRVRVL